MNSSNFQQEIITLVKLVLCYMLLARNILHQQSTILRKWVEHFSGRLHF